MVPSLWAQYVTESLGGTRRFIEHDWGFASYSFPTAMTDCIMIHDMFILPELRQTGRGRDLFNEVCWIGQTAGKKYVLAEVELGSAVYPESMKAQLAVGLVPISANQDRILMRKVL